MTHQHASPYSDDDITLRSGANCLLLPCRIGNESSSAHHRNQTNQQKLDVPKLPMSTPTRASSGKGRSGMASDYTAHGTRRQSPRRRNDGWEEQQSLLNILSQPSPHRYCHWSRSWAQVTPPWLLIHSDYSIVQLFLKQPSWAAAEYRGVVCCFGLTSYPVAVSPLLNVSLPKGGGLPKTQHMHLYMVDRTLIVQ